MRLKLDENIDARLAVILRGAGHDAMTVPEQSLHGTNDVDLYQLCISESRMLITLDLDFSNVLRYPPESTPGMIVLRGPDDLFATVSILRSHRDPHGSSKQRVAAEPALDRRAMPNQNSRTNMMRPKGLRDPQSLHA